MYNADPFSEHQSTHTPASKRGQSIKSSKTRAPSYRCRRKGGQIRQVRVEVGGQGFSRLTDKKLIRSADWLISFVQRPPWYHSVVRQHRILTLLQLTNRLQLGLDWTASRSSIPARIFLPLLLSRVRPPVLRRITPVQRTFSQFESSGCHVQRARN